MWQGKEKQPKNRLYSVELIVILDISVSFFQFYKILHRVFCGMIFQNCTRVLDRAPAQLDSKFWSKLRKFSDENRYFTPHWCNFRKFPRIRVAVPIFPIFWRILNQHSLISADVKVLLNLDTDYLSRSYPYFYFQLIYIFLTMVLRSSLIFFIVLWVVIRVSCSRFILKIIALRSEVGKSRSDLNLVQIIWRKVSRIWSRLKSDFFLGQFIFFSRFVHTASR